MITDVFREVSFQEKPKLKISQALLYFLFDEAKETGTNQSDVSDKTGQLTFPRADTRVDVNGFPWWMP